MYKLALSLIITMLMMSSAQARLLLDISVLNKKGIDIGLTLGSELHSTEEVHFKEDIALTMKSGISVLLRASFDEKIESGEKVMTLAEPVSAPDPKKDKAKDKAKAKAKDKEEITEVKEVKIIGPSSDIIIRGRVIDADGTILKDFFEEPLKVSLGDTMSVEHSKNSQLVEIKIKPHLQ